MIERSVASPAARLKENWCAPRELCAEELPFSTHIIDEGMAILTGVNPHGKSGADSVNHAVAIRLREWAVG